MKATVYGFLAALGLGLASAPVFAEDPILLTTVEHSDKIIAKVEVVDLNGEQVDRLLSEHKRHQEALAKLREEHQRSIEAILASSSR